MQSNNLRRVMNDADEPTDLAIARARLREDASDPWALTIVRQHHLTTDEADSLDGLDTAMYDHISKHGPASYHDLANVLGVRKDRIQRIALKCSWFRVNRKHMLVAIRLQGEEKFELGKPK